MYNKILKVNMVVTINIIDRSHRDEEKQDYALVDNHCSEECEKAFMLWAYSTGHQDLLSTETT